MKPVRIAQRSIGDGEPCFVIAEVGVNHNGDRDLAHRLIDLSVEAGADAVKFQTFRAEDVAGSGAAAADFQKRGTGREESQLAMLRRLELSLDAHRALRAHCEASGILFLSTPFDPRSADMLHDLGVPAFKVSSGDIDNTILLDHLASKRIPILLSTGMSSRDEVGHAIEVIEQRHGRRDRLVLLHCVSSYPAAPTDCNLQVITCLEREFAVPAGWSDHTEGIDIAIAAVALGARVVEKHLTLDRRLPGPDHRASLEPEELSALISSIRRVEEARGDGVKRRRASEVEAARLGRRSLHWASDLARGESVEADSVISLRPGTGIPPSQVDRVVGRTIRRGVRRSEMVQIEDLA